MERLGHPDRAVREHTGATPGEPDRPHRPTALDRFPWRLGDRTAVAWWVAPALVWLVTRWMLLAEVLADAQPWMRAVTGDIRIYAYWVSTLAEGRFPVDDHAWQYPPGAALLIVAPDAVARGDIGRYFYAFFTMVLLADAVTGWLLARRVRSGASQLGVWYWTLAIPALGLICYSRLDVPVTAMAVAALALAARPALAGLVIGFATAVKGWPIMLLGGFRRWGPAVRAGAGAGLLLTGCWLVLTLWFPDAFDFLTQQSRRGLEVEAVVATFFVLTRVGGDEKTDPEGAVQVSYRYGSWEFVGDGVETALAVAQIGLVLGLVFLAVWWLRARWQEAVLADAAMCAALISMVTSRVLSPQYLIWAVGLAAVCLTYRRTSQRPIAAILLLCAVLTQLEFPVLWDGMFFRTPGFAGVVSVRNGLLVLATLWSAVRLWRSTRPLPRGTAVTAETAGTNGAT